MSTDWIPVTDSLPDPAERVLVLHANGKWQPGKLVREHMRDLRLGPKVGWVWIDDESRILVNVVAWTRIVAPGETP